MPGSPDPVPARARIARATPDAGAQQALAMAEARLRTEAATAGAQASSPLARIAVIGAGAMGSTIAMAAVQVGLAVVLVDSDPERLRAAGADIDRWGAQAVRDADRVAGTIEHTTELARIEGSDVVIESIVEDAAPKCALLAAVEGHLRPGTLVTSNTSSLDIDLLASALREPGRFLGTHFFLPAHRIPMVEVVPGKATSAAPLEQALALAARLGKMPVCVGNAPGFVGNRLFDRLWQEALLLVEEGALPEQVDGALERWGLALGPFATLDRIGLSLIDSVLARQRPGARGARLPSLVGALCAAGRTGIAVQRGWFDYSPGSRRGSPSGDVQQLLEHWSGAQGRTRRRVTADELVARPVLAVIDEARGLLARGIAGRPGDIDVLFTRAYGFPAWCGGPLALAATLGPEALQEEASLYPHLGALSP